MRVRKSDNIYLKKQDARYLKILKDNSIDLICTHPPYSNIVKYSDNLEGDISLLETNEFYEQMKLVAQNCYRVLKPKKYCAILMGDKRKKGLIEPIGFDTMNIFLQAGFKLKEIVIKEQHNCKNTEKWKQISTERNFLLIAHEYLFVFVKDQPLNYKDQEVFILFRDILLYTEICTYKKVRFMGEIL